MPGTSNDGGGNGVVKGDGLHTQPAGLSRLSPILPMDAPMFDHLTVAELKAIEVARLSYAQDVCARAALAYQQILAIVSAS